MIVAQLVRALVCGSRGRRFEPGLSPKPLFQRGFCILYRGELAQRLTIQKKLNHTQMFTLYKSSPKFPVVKPVNIRLVHNYFVKFEESLRIFEEIQREAIHS